MDEGHTPIPYTPSGKVRMSVGARSMRDSPSLVLPMHYTLISVDIKEYKRMLYSDPMAGKHPCASHCRFGSFLEGVELFDCAAFGISHSEVLLLDPQQRLLMEAMAAIGLQHHSPTARSRCGVYVGMSSIDYARLTARYSPETTAYSATGKSQKRVSVILHRMCTRSW